MSAGKQSFWKWAGPMTALAAAALATGPALAAPPGQKTVTITGLTGLWVIDQKDFDRHENPPYTPEGQALAAKKKADVEGGKVIDDEQLKCLPQGMPGLMLGEFAIEILESPGRVTMIAESSPLVRSVYLNRDKPTEGLEPMWNGYSVGHWEGDTLAVKTDNFNDKIFPLGFGGTVHASTTTVNERFTVSPDGKRLTDEMTLVDQRYLTGPFTIVRHYDRQPDDAELWEYACEVGAAGWAERFKGDKSAAEGGL